MRIFIESFLCQLIDNLNKTKYQKSNCGLCIKMAFANVPRNFEAERIVSIIEGRQSSWSPDDRYSGRDKEANPLITIPGSPGIGKSRFLLEFPDSAAYKAYIQEFSPESESIVAPFTFNSFMNGPSESYSTCYGFSRIANILWCEPCHAYR